MKRRREPSPERLLEPTLKLFEPDHAKLCAILQHVVEVKFQTHNDSPNIEPKTWRRAFPEKDVLARMQKSVQNSIEWDQFRREGTGSSSELGVMCGWSKHESNVSLFRFHMGHIARDVPSEFDSFCKSAGHVFEHIETSLYEVSMGARTHAVGTFVHNKFPHKHTSPDPEVEMNPGVFHNIFGVHDARTGLQEDKFKIGALPHAIIECGVKTLCPIGAQPEHVIQCTDQLTVRKQTNPELHWNDLVYFRDSRTVVQGSTLPKVAVKKDEPFAEFRVLRIYFSESMSANIYRHFHQHVAAVRAGVEPKFVHQPNLGRVRIVPLKRVLFFVGDDSKITCKIESFWDFVPVEISLHDLVRTPKDPCTCKPRCPPRAVS